MHFPVSWFGWNGWENYVCLFLQAHVMYTIKQIVAELVGMFKQRVHIIINFTHSESTDSKFRIRLCLQAPVISLTNNDLSH